MIAKHLTDERGEPKALPFVSSTRVQLAAIVFVSICVRFVLARGAPIPWLMPDELVYAGLGRQLSEGHFTTSLWAYGPVYPLLIAPLERFLSPQRAFEAIQLFNACAFSLAAVPAFLLARRVLSRDRAVAASALVLLVPSGFYTSRAMTEAVAYPLALFSLLAIVRAVEHPTLRAQTFAVTAIGLASCTRIELLGLAAVFAVTVVALAIRDRRARPDRSLWSFLRPFRVMGALGIAGAALLCAVALRGSVASTHGFATGRLSAGPLAASILSHVALLDLGAGVAPVAACVLLLAAARSRDVGRAVLTLSVAAASSAVVLCAISAAYLTSLPHTGGDPPVRVFDRYTFYALPMLLISLLVWLERRELWPRRRTIVLVGAVCVALVGAVPYDRLLTGREWGASTSSIALLPVVLVHDVVRGPYVPVIAALVVAAALTALLAMRTPENRAAVYVAVLFIITGVLAVKSGDNLASRVQAISGPEAWVARANLDPPQRIPLLWVDTGRANAAFGLWETELGNRNVGPVYDVEQPLPNRFDEFPLGEQTFTGYVIAPLTLRLGPVAAENRTADLAVFRLVRPLTAVRVRALVGAALGPKESRECATAPEMRRPARAAAFATRAAQGASRQPPQRAACPTSDAR